MVEVKETRLSLNIDTNDFNAKLNGLPSSWQPDGQDVRFRGREMAHSAHGRRRAEAVCRGSASGIRKPPVLEGRTMSILLIPKPNKGLILGGN